MSENKYIIDKDSLTGIADAVRNKLGNGEAITDEDAGYYPVPAKKLGFFEKASTADYSGPGSGYEGNPIYARPILDLENICGIRPSYIKITVTNSTGFNDNDIIFRYTNADSPNTSRVASANFANYIAILPIPDDIDDCYIAYGAYYSTYSSQYSHRRTPPYDVVFLDSNQNEININGYSGNSFVVDKWGTTRTFLTGTSFEKIPFSIDDIQDRITNYLIKKDDSVKSVMFFLNDSANDNEHTSSVHWNYGWFIDLNGSYASNTLLKLRPENIQYILSYSPFSSNGTNYYQYDPKIKALQHYTSFSLNESGYSPRISGVTDYYFLANATKRYTSYTFGLACFDNGTELDFQIVKKLSGSTLEGQLNASRFTDFQPTVFFIIYKEA